MKIIIISTLYYGGGAEIQAKFEKKIMERRGDDVRLITLDPEIGTDVVLENNHINIYGKYSITKKRIYDSFIYFKLLNKIKKYIDNFNPDIIHLHNVSFAFNTVCLAIKGYKTVQTIHDYSIICDKGDMLLPDCKLCTACEFRHCFSVCYRKRCIKIIYRFFIMSLQRMFRQKYVNTLISPSECLKKWCMKYGYRVYCLNNAIDLEAFSKFEKKLFTNRKIVFYYGAIRENKGILKLLEYYNTNDYNSVELHIAGRIEKNVDEQVFRKMLEEKGAKYCGHLSYQEIIHKLETVYAVIVPSIGAENYPNTALEGIWSECVVCGSNRGGIPEIIAEENLIFDIFNQEQVENCLKKIDLMTEEERKEICKKQKKQFMNTNTPDKYLKGFMKIMKE